MGEMGGVSPPNTMPPYSLLVKKERPELFELGRLWADGFALA